MVSGGYGGWGAGGERSQSAVEYILLLVTLSVIVLFAGPFFSQLRDNVRDIFNTAVRGILAK